MASEKLTRKVRIIETILKNDNGQDLKILRELLIMIDKFGFEPVVINETVPKADFIDKLLRGKERFIHLSTHGNKNGFYIPGDNGSFI